MFYLFLPDYFSSLFCFVMLLFSGPVFVTEFICYPIAMAFEIIVLFFIENLTKLCCVIGNITYLCLMCIPVISCNTYTYHNKVYLLYSY